MKEKGSLWVVNLGSVRGIPLRIHTTFFLLLLLIALDAKAAGLKVSAEVLYVISVFACVLLHELGHALTARIFGISTRDIVLYPFGGIASLSGQPKPFAELLIAVAGPAVNIVIAFALWPFVSGFESATAALGSSSLVDRMFLTNILLAVFNMIPAIPMDGGRVLRAALQLAGLKHATLLACRVSQALSICMGIFAFFTGQWLLLLVSAVVFSNSFQELIQERTRTGLGGRVVRDFMTDARHLQILTHGTTVSQALPEVLKSLQSTFPVLHGDQVIGMLDKDEIIAAAVESGEDQYISGLMRRSFPIAAPNEALTSVLPRMEASQGNALLVLDKGALCGIIFRDKLLDFLLLQGLRREAQGGSGA